MESILIRNPHLTVRLNPIGAVFSSIQKDGHEYLWQGDEAFWDRKDANLFPCVGRSFAGRYRLGNREYPMSIHGFCQDARFMVTKQEEDRVVFTLTDSPETREIYPFAFTYQVEYKLEDNRIHKTCRVENRGEETMHFGLGSHPGFRVPLDGGEFTDWAFVFSAPCHPRRVCFNHNSWLLAPERPAYPLEEDRRLPLRHDLFDYDAIVLENTSGAVTLQSEKSSRRVRVEYPQMPYVGFWHTPNGDAPFVCVEPWLSLPAPDDHMPDWETLEGLIHLPAGERYENTITIIIT